MVKGLFFSLVLFSFFIQSLRAQSTADSIQMKKEIVSLEEALNNPEKVYRLNLSNQNIQIPDTIWSKFTNLQFLSLKNDHLKQIPNGIGNLKNLQVLDLSGNDFKVLPSTFSRLSKLEELFLNDEKNFQFEKNITILSNLPSLRFLHLENDGLKRLPKSFYNLNQIQSLYLNDNKFKEVPKELIDLKNLRYLEMQNNAIVLPAPELQGFGIEIRF
ncbi:MAG: leucine-rich repeat domain-containing protein [Cyclobacteriaceae bacterium]|nr:leucine-rich repeat domain-containing protein [Cyclobacteriaceae bacterium]